jgi:hydroxypyruvate isomerase
MDDQTGLKNCVDGLRQIMPTAEKHGVIVQMELFNQQDHPDYMCDSTAWGVALCKAIGSDHFKLLYDIYHMQIQEGNIIDTIRKYHTYFGHYHTAGVPGRGEIDETQELNYSAIANAVAETGFNGYLSQEFVPKAENKMASLKEAIMICDV